MLTHSEQVNRVQQALETYRVSRRELVRLHHEIGKLGGGQWRFAARLRHDAIVQHEYSGTMPGDSVITTLKADAPLNDVRLIDQSGNPPPEGAAEIQLLRTYNWHLSRAAYAVAFLRTALRALAHESEERGHADRAERLEEFRRSLPVAPFYSRNDVRREYPNGEIHESTAGVASVADREQELSKDEARLRAVAAAVAMLTMPRELQRADNENMASGGEEIEQKPGHPECPPAARMAHGQYQKAVEESPNELATDAEVYNFVRENIADDPSELPSLETWSRHLRAFRKATGDQKRKARKGTATPTRSMVRGRDLRKSE